MQKEHIKCRTCGSDRVRIYVKKTKKGYVMRTMLINCDNCGASYDELERKKNETE